LGQGHYFLRSPARIVLLALLLRIVLVIPSHLSILKPANDHYPANDHFRFGWEMGRVARSIATGEGFSSPYGDSTGPTAALPPAYPYLLSGVFKLCGVYSETSAIVILILDSLFSSLTCWTIFLIAEGMFGQGVAEWAGWTWAFLPSAVYLSIKSVWETTLTTFLVSLALLLALRLKPMSPLWAWLGFGSICALATLSSSVAVLVSPMLLAWPLLRCPWDTVKSLRGIGAAVLVFLLILSPWVVRNYVAFHRLILLRSNFGLELHIGNNPEANGMQVLRLHPAHNAKELEEYRGKGELAYMSSKEHAALQFIASHPKTVALLTLKRVAYWWAVGPSVSGGSPLKGGSEAAELLGYSLLSFLAVLGLGIAIRNRKEGVLLFAALLLLYPLVYYGTLVHFRYRHPLEPIMVILSIYALQRVFFGRRDRSQPATLTPGTEQLVAPRV
jgi:4-amino-4-deoxy-L-arabinose transferase-like glycosyltransferase